MSLSSLDPAAPISLHDDRERYVLFRSLSVSWDLCYSQSKDYGDSFIGHMTLDVSVHFRSNITSMPHKYIDSRLCAYDKSIWLI